MIPRSPAQLAAILREQAYYRNHELPWDHEAYKNANEADVERHLEARYSQLTWLVNTTNVERLYDAWGLKLGLVEVFEAYRQAREALAGAIGIDAESLFTFDGRHTEQAQSLLVDRSDSAELIQRYESRLAQYPRIDAKLASQVVNQAILFADRLGLSLQCPWVVADLITIFLEAHVPCLLYGIPEIHVPGRGWRYLAPPVRLSFETLPDESVEDAKTRLRKEYNRVMSELEDSKLPAGKLEKNSLEKMWTWTQWWCEKRLANRTLYAIAKDLHVRLSPEHQTKEFPECGCRQTIRHGIDRAEELLALGSAEPPGE